MNNRKIGIKMGGYTNRDNRIMDRAELNNAISDIQDENERLRDALAFYGHPCSWSTPIMRQGKMVYIPTNRMSMTGPEVALEALGELVNNKTKATEEDVETNEQAEKEKQVECLNEVVPEKELQKLES